MVRERLLRLQSISPTHHFIKILELTIQGKWSSELNQFVRVNFHTHSFPSLLDLTVIPKFVLFVDINISQCRRSAAPYQAGSLTRGNMNWTSLSSLTLLSYWETDNDKITFITVALKLVEMNSPVDTFKVLLWNWTFFFKEYCLSGCIAVTFTFLYC